MSRLRSLALVVALLCVPSLVHAQITCTADTDFDATGAQSTDQPTIVIPTNIAVGDLLLLLTSERDGGSTINSIVGSVSGSWSTTPISSSTGTGGDSRFFYKISTAAGADTITVTYSGSVTSRIAGGHCSVSGTTPVLDEFDATPKTGSSTTPDSDAITPNEGDGLAIGALALSGDQDITDPGSGQTDLTNEAQAVHMLRKTATNGVAVNFTTVTIDGSRDWAFHIAAFTQPAASATCNGGMLTSGAGKACVQ